MKRILRVIEACSLLKFSHVVYLIAVAVVVCPPRCWAQGCTITTANGSDDEAGRLLSPKTSPHGSPSITAKGVVSASAFGKFSAVAPGSLMEIYGSNLASDTLDWGSAFSGVNAPTSLGGTSVTIGDEDAFVAYVSPTQVNVEVPSGVGTGLQPVIVKTGSGESSPQTITVNATEPGLLAPASFNIGGKQYVAAFFSDNVTLALPPGAISGVPSRRAQPGAPLTLYGIGFGGVIPNLPAGQIVQESNMLSASFQIKFGTTLAMVTYAGLAPGETGVYQFDVTVPSIPSNDAVPLTFTLGGVAATQTLYIAVQNGSPALQVASLSLSANSVAGGGTVQGTVALSAPAPSGGVVVALSSNSSAASVPATVTVPADATSATFTVSTSAVSSSQGATITASYGGGSAQALLAVNQAVAVVPFVSLTCVVTFQPVGYPSFQLVLQVTPNAGNMTYTAEIVNPGIAFINGFASNQNQTFAFNALQPGLLPFTAGTTALQVTSGHLAFTIMQSAALGSSFAVGSVTGTLSITGTPYLVGGNSVTVSGVIVGTYSATLQPQ